MENQKKNGGPDNRRVDIMESVPAEFLTLAQSVAAAYPVVEPGEEFRAALRRRVVGEGYRLLEEPPAKSRARIVARAALGAAAVSVAGIAVVAWRTRAIPSLISQAQGQLRAVQGR